MKVKRLLVGLLIMVAFTSQVHAASFVTPIPMTSLDDVLRAYDDKGQPIGSSANGINNKNQVVGYYFTAEDSPKQACMWENGKRTNLGTLGGRNSYAYGINDKGQVFGTSIATDNDYHAFIWENGKMTDLGIPGCTYGIINNKEQVVGYYYKDWIPHAFIWENGKWTDFGANTWAYGINDKGQIVGSGYIGDSIFPHACIWENGKITDLGTLGIFDSYGKAINNKGQVAGDYQTSDHYNRAFIWENGKMTDLGTLGGKNSHVNGINDKGQVVGYSDTSDGTFHAFIWENGKITDLGTLGGSYSWANGINDKGQVVGYALLLYGPTHAFLWESNVDSTPPSITAVEPSDTSILDAKAKIIVKASDNVAISSIKLQYSLDGIIWNDIETQNTEGTAEFTWDTTALKGSVKVKAIAVDTSGNESTNSPVYTYTIGNDVTTKSALSISETHVNAASLSDISINIGDNKLSSIMNGTGTLIPSVDYNVSGSTVIISKSYLNYYFKKFLDQNLYLNFNFNTGSSSIFTIFTGDTPHVVLTDALSYKLGSGDAELSLSPNGNFITSVKNGDDFLAPRIDYTYAPSTRVFYLRKGYLNSCFSKTPEPSKITIGFTGDSPKTVIITPVK